MEGADLGRRLLAGGVLAVRVALHEDRVEADARDQLLELRILREVLHRLLHRFLGQEIQNLLHQLS